MLSYSSIFPYVFMECRWITTTLATNLIKVKYKSIPVRDNGSPQASETSRFPRYLEDPFIDDGEVVSLTRRLPHPLPPRKIPGSVSTNYATACPKYI